MQYEKMKFAVGLFVSILILTIFASLYLLLDEKGTFDKRYSYHFSTDSAETFNVGMPLKFSGFNIGVIDNIALKDDGSVFMTFSVTSKYRKWIAEDSVLMIKKPLIGSPHIELYSAKGNKTLKEGSQLVILKSDDINDMISKFEPAVNRLINIVNSIDIITSKMSKDDSNLNKTMQNIEKFSGNLAVSNSLLTSVTGDDASTKNLIKTINSTTKIVGEVDKISKDISAITAKLDANIVTPASVSAQELEKILKDVKQKLDTLDSTVKTVGSYDKDLVELKEQISVGLIKSNQIMDRVDGILQNKKKSEIKLP
ncbi:MlaD family protein [Sulfurimonas sp.]|uniref:MlaD family protein n=1 Tax=Sulfurimonas sp. TaxID=2022749 RepID=UPI0025E0697E|nr:MlaD family protein [Sulfurimonas sp.]MDD5157964.1 MlaD family protein [Sulfurimonas sp.]